MATVQLGQLKTGEDVTFRDIVVAVDGDPQDLTAGGWEVACQFRPDLSAGTFVAPDIDADALVESRVRLSLDRVATAKMRRDGVTHATWYADVRITGPDGQKLSDTFTVLVVMAVTR